MLLTDRRNILEIWRKIFVDLEKHVAKYVGDFGENMFGNLEKTYLAIFGENVSTIWRNRLAILERTVR